MVQSQVENMDRMDDGDAIRSTKTVEYGGRCMDKNLFLYTYKCTHEFEKNIEIYDFANLS